MSMQFNDHYFGGRNRGQYDGGELDNNTLIVKLEKPSFGALSLLRISGVADWILEQLGITDGIAQVVASGTLMQSKPSRAYQSWMKNMRTEFGFDRTECGCRTCRRNCMYMPGFLIPSDLERMIPTGTNPLQWAETNLLASPGALVMKAGNLLRIRTLVPATKQDGSCIHYKQRKCQIHATAPFGCAFFDCGPERGNLSQHGLREVMKAHIQNGLYAQIWNHLNDLGLNQERPDVLRGRMMKGEWE